MQANLVAGEIAANSEAFEILPTLCDKYGSRFSFSQEEKASAEFIATKLREYGLQNVHIEPFSNFGWIDGEITELWKWQRGTASLEIVKPNHHQLHCISLPNAPSTLEEGVTAEIFNLKSGSRAYLIEHREELKGKFVLDGTYMTPDTYYASRDPNNLYLPTFFGYLEKFGAAGMLFNNRFYGNLPSTGASKLGLIGTIPACGISRETADFILRQLLKGPVYAKLKVKNTYAPGATSQNVIADIQGQVYPNEIIVVGGHYDGHDISVGAMDNAAGACVVIEAARALIKHAGSPKRTIRFCLFGSEEIGLNGSTNYVLDHADELKNIVLMINTDGAGRSTKTHQGFTAHAPKELVSYLESVLNRLGSFNRDRELPPVNHSIRPYSDHFPFYMHGIPTAQIHGIPVDPITEQYGHTSADTVDKVPPKGLKDAAILLALTVMTIANDDTIPIKHTPIDQVIEILEEKEIAKNLRIEKRWRREFPD